MREDKWTEPPRKPHEMCPWFGYTGMLSGEYAMGEPDYDGPTESDQRKMKIAEYRPWVPWYRFNSHHTERITYG